jgi:hypothetical protein
VTGQGLKPWLAAFQPDLLDAAQNADLEAFLAQANRYATDEDLRTGLGHRLRFGPQHQRYSAAGYEQHIANTGEVPTRDNPHDRYNALIWMHFPKTKAALNRLQVTEMARAPVGGPRGRVRDTATLWDESLAVLTVTPHEEDTVTQLLSDHAWETLFCDYRSQWHNQWKLCLFGHALLEKLDKPYKGITAHLVVLGMNPNAAAPDSVDLVLAQKVGRGLHPGLLRPLPVLGVPTWHAENEDPLFYRDTAVFRPV